MEDQFEINPRIEIYGGDFRSEADIVRQMVTVTHERMTERHGEEAVERIQQACVAAGMMMKRYLHNVKGANMAAVCVNDILHAVNEYARDAHKELQSSSNPVPVSAFHDAAPLFTQAIMEHWLEAATTILDTIKDGRMYQEQGGVKPMGGGGTVSLGGDGTAYHDVDFSQRMN